jgi:deazaflavin-dependent oxidoreductase (nitroreductase family)
MKPETAVKFERRWGRIFFPFHRWLFKTTRGYVGGKFEGRSMLLLHHVGRKTGQPRETLIQYYPHGEEMIVVASNGGRDNAPAWLHNVQANPDVGVDIRGKRLKARARVLEGSEREVMWEELHDFYPGYKHYQTLTDRRIEVVALTPQG